MLENIVIYIFFAYFATAIGNAFTFLTDAGQIFGKWQDVVEWVYNKTGSNFIYKALGGCDTCFTMWISILVVYPLYWYFGTKYGFYIAQDWQTTAALWLLMPLLTFDIYELKNKI